MRYHQINQTATPCRGPLAKCGGTISSWAFGIKQMGFSFLYYPSEKYIYIGLGLVLHLWIYSDPKDSGAGSLALVQVANIRI